MLSPVFTERPSMSTLSCLIFSMMFAGSFPGSCMSIIFTSTRSPYFFLRSPAMASTDIGNPTVRCLPSGLKRFTRTTFTDLLSDTNISAKDITLRASWFKIPQNNNISLGKVTIAERSLSVCSWKKSPINSRNSLISSRKRDTFITVTGSPLAGSTSIKELSVTRYVRSSILSRQLPGAYSSIL